MSSNLPESQPSDEVDLGQLFKIIGRAFDRFFSFIGRIFNGLFLAFVWMVFFVKKHAIKILIAAVVGFGLGFVKQKLGKPTYKSMIIVKQNYNTGENLYNTINYYNELIANKDSLALSESLNITPIEANTILEIELESVLNENKKLRLFDEYTKELDSTFATTMKFEDYVENSNEYDYQLQKISLRSLSNKTLKNVFLQIINNIESIEFFKNEQKKDLAQLNRRESIVRESLLESDSLQQVYQEVLKKSAEKVAGGATSITFEGADDKSVTKEFELYNSDILLRRELVEIERKKEDKEYIIEIVSSNQNIGTIDADTALLGYGISYKIKYTLFLSLSIFVILLLIEFMNYLERFKSKI